MISFVFGEIFLKLLLRVLELISDVILCACFLSFVFSQFNRNSKKTKPKRKRMADQPQTFTILSSEKISELKPEELLAYALACTEEIQKKRQIQKERYAKYQKKIQLTRKWKNAMTAHMRSEKRLAELNHQLAEYESAKKKERENTINKARGVHDDESETDEMLAEMEEELHEGTD